MKLATHNEDKTDNLIIYYQNTRSLHNQKDELTTIFLNRNLKSSSEAHTLSENRMKDNETIIEQQSSAGIKI